MKNLVYTLGPVLIVEDDPDLLEILADIVKSLKLEVITARNGIEAYILLQNNKVSMIIADIVMPLCGGISLLIKARKANISAPFVFITGYQDRERLIEAVRLGAMDFLIKHIDVPIFQAMVQRVFEISKREAYKSDLLRFLSLKIHQQTNQDIQNIERQINSLRATGIS